MDALTQVRQTVEAYGMFTSGETVVVGVSGGPDSLCLLHALMRLRTDYSLSLHVAHLNHQLRGQEADADAAFVAQTAADWGLPATVEARDVATYARERKLAIEEAARQARYAFLARVAQEVGAGCAAVGHNADDQVESVLMHFLRGAGLAGLRGMQPVSPWPRQPVTDPPVRLKLLRPLLEVPRAVIESYCREHGLQPRFDRSNLDLTFYRNRLRHELIPTLETYNPGFRQVVRRSAVAIADDYDYLRHEMLSVWQKLATRTDEGYVFPLAPWLGLHPSLQRGLLREAIRRLRRGLRNINWVHIEHALTVAHEKPTGSSATLPQGLSLFKGYDTITVGEAMPAPELPVLTSQPIALAVPGVTTLPGSPWRIVARIMAREALSVEQLMNPDRWQAVMDGDKAGVELSLRCRRPGDRFQPLGMGGRSKRLGEFMIDHKIPRHVRDRLPLVVANDQIVWLPGWRLDERVQVTDATRKVLVLRLERG